MSKRLNSFSMLNSSFSILLQCFIEREWTLAGIENAELSIENELSKARCQTG